MDKTIEAKVREILDGYGYTPPDSDGAIFGSEEYKNIIIDLTALINDLIAQNDKATATGLFNEIICPMCYRLNPQHESMDNGEGCYWCQERGDWCGETLADASKAKQEGE